MDAKLLIDAIVQQTTILIAHLSTAAGLRAPLAHVADQVFVDLAREIEAQGVSRKVAADMFGLALRSYQKKVGRLTAGVTDKQRTLWEAVHDFVIAEGRVTRERVLERFRYDGEEQVGAVLNDLVTSGLAYRTGRGASSVYRGTADEDYAEFVRRERADAAPWLVWVTIYRSGGILRDRVAGTLPFEQRVLDAAIADLIADGRVVENETADGVELRASTFLVPVGSTVGWEAAVFDHFQALCNAVSAKLSRGVPGSSTDDIVGGATLSFDVYPGHPFESAVYGTLARVRQDINVLWRAVAEHNATHPLPEHARKVSFYFGQYVTADDVADMAEEPHTQVDP